MSTLTSIQRRLHDEFAPVSGAGQIVTTAPRPAPVPPPPQPVVQPSAGQTLFHADWWLDAVCPGRWQEVSVKEDGVAATWRFALERRAGLLVSELPPFTRQLGPVVWLKPKADSHRVVSRLTAALWAQTPKTLYFQTGLSDDWIDILSLQRLGFRIRAHQSLILDTAVGRDALLAGMSQSRRSNVRRAEKKFEVVNLRDPELFADFYSVCLKERHQRRSFSLDRLPAVYEACEARQCGEFLAAKDEKGQIAAVTFAAWDTRRSYQLLWARRADSDMASSLLTWENIARAAERKLTFDFDGITTESRLDFLSGFGGRADNRFLASCGAPLHRGLKGLRTRFRNLINRAPNFGL